MYSRSTAQRERDSSEPDEQPLRTTVVRTADDIAASLKPWLAFQNGNPNGASYYNDPRRIQYLLDEGALLEGLIVLVWRGDRIVAVAPLAAEKNSAVQMGGRTLNWLRRRPGMAGLGDEIPVATDANAANCLHAVAQAWAGHQPSFSSIYLRQIDVRSECWRYFHSKKFRKTGLRAIVPRAAPELSHHLRIQPTFQDYQRLLSGRSRHRFRNDRRRFFDPLKRGMQAIGPKPNSR